MEKLSDRIAILLKAMEGPERGKQSRLAKLADCTRGLVNQWVMGLNETMGYEYAKNIERELGFRIEWLINGEGPQRMTDKAMSNLERAATTLREVEPAKQQDASAVMVNGDEIIELMSLYQQASDNGKRFILNAARGAVDEQAPRWRRVNGNEY